MILKFRAWDRSSKQMLYYGEKNNVFIYASRYRGNVTWEFGESLYDWEVKGTDNTRGVLMQFTGIEGIDGKEIYEGDIVEIVSGEEHQGMREFSERGIVVFSCGAFGIKTKEGVSMSFDQMFNGDPEITVIGNFCENPEYFKL